MTGVADAYVHGLPGSAAEADVAFPAARRPRAVLAPWEVESFLARPGASGPVRLAAFSLGAFAALAGAARHPEAVRGLVLLAPAAPLQLGRFLPEMAGAPVFRAARMGGAPLAMLTAAQAAALRAAPRRVLGAMFARAAPAERALLADPRVHAMLVAGLHGALLTRRADYRRSVRAYVADWSAALDRIACPVTILHGADDRWAPPAMARALAARLGDRATLHVLPGLGHYGTLLHAGAAC